MALIGRWDRDVRAAMKGRRNVRVELSRTLLASCLWDLGEDDLVDRALTMSDDDLAAVQRIASVYEDPDHPLPREGRIAHVHVNAFAAIAYFEGSLRPLARTNRRPQKDRPPQLR